MRIGIIGAGNIGSNLARRLTATGHEVRIANSRGPETLADLAAETGATPVEVGEAAQDADAVVVTIPMARVPELPDDVLAGAKAGAPVIDTNNYYPQQRDGRIAAIEEGTTESRWVAQQLGHDVVKAFNGIYAAQIVEHARDKGDAQRRALPIAGDDPVAKGAVMELVEAIGFDPIDAGGLDDSWRQQPGTPSYGEVADVDGMRELLAQASQERTADWKA